MGLDFSGIISLFWLEGFNKSAEVSVGEVYGLCASGFWGASLRMVCGLDMNWPTSTTTLSQSTRSARIQGSICCGATVCRRECILSLHETFSPEPFSTQMGQTVV